MADLGAGNSTSYIVKDTACLQGRDGKQICAEPLMLMSMTMDDEPFAMMPSDGIVGLGLNLSDHDSSFFSGLIENTPGMLPQLGVSLSSSGGELHIGSYDPKLLANPIQWSEVDTPDDGYWQVKIKSVRIGNRTLDSCEKGCRAIIDTSAHRLGVQNTNYGMIRSALNPTLTEDAGCQGPELHFEIEGMDVTLGADDYTDQACAVDLGWLDLPASKFTGVYAFGEMVLRHYFVVFDWKSKSIGFAPLSGGARDCRANQRWISW